MNIGEESEAIEVPIPVHPDEVLPPEPAPAPAEAPVPQPAEPVKVPA